MYKASLSLIDGTIDDVIDCDVDVALVFVDGESADAAIVTVIFVIRDGLVDDTILIIVFVNDAEEVIIINVVEVPVDSGVDKDGLGDKTTIDGTILINRKHGKTPGYPDLRDTLPPE
ncbi:hypothetical protein NDU88_006960 [Pleurodeles waltl]|uniref:Uncharacterized protein n=1 Tax=Pleurodeles waltl TaxID=8319 RepID=A0AAV7TZ32_PLEWA|nr:hypothetical protein NDU88_006960 [Pleurodeles waltl]